MPPRSATNHAAPASLLADALSAFQKAAGNAVSPPVLVVRNLDLQRTLQLAAADEQAKLEVAQARAERDEARRLMHDAKLQCKDWERRGEVSKSNVGATCLSPALKLLTLDVTAREGRVDGVLRAPTLL